MKVPDPETCNYTKWLAEIPICILNCKPCCKCSVNECNNVIDLVEIDLEPKGAKSSQIYIDETDYNNLTLDQVISILTTNPNIKITHNLFDKSEYIYGKSGKVFDENNYLFEDWYSDGPGKHDGIRSRSEGRWLNGWSIYKEN